MNLLKPEMGWWFFWAYLPIALGAAAGVYAIIRLLIFVIVLQFRLKKITKKTCVRQHILYVLPENIIRLYGRDLGKRYIQRRKKIFMQLAGE